MLNLLKLLILPLLFLSEEDKPNDILWFSMVLSDAQPVQFWPVECDTYNQHVHDGVFHRCFCQPWNCTDIIKVQFKETLSGSPGSADDFILSVRDESNTEIYSLPFTTETPLSLDPLTAGENFGSGTSWTIDADPNVNTTSKIIRFAINGASSNRDYEFGYDINKINSLGFTGGTIEIKLYDTDMIELDAFSITVPFGVGVDYTGTVTFNGGDEIPAYIGVNIIVSAGTMTTTINELSLVTEADEFTVYNLSFDLSELSPELCDQRVNFVIVNESTDTDMAKSDCQQISSVTKNTILITYTNHENVFGLAYTNQTPRFNLRIPATFYHQRFPGQDEVIELSSSILTLNSTLRRQRLLETDFLPYYFHEKIIMALQHQFVDIISKAWVKQEGYEVAEGNRMYPEKKAKVWLGEQNFLQRNVL